MVRVENGVVLVRNGIFPWEMEEFHLDDAFSAVELLPRWEHAGLTFRGKGPRWMHVDCGDHVVLIGKDTFQGGQFVIERTSVRLNWYQVNGRMLTSTAA